MIKIAHRGNFNGPSKKENAPEQIQLALDLGYHVEVDVWFDRGDFYLGHDAPQYRVDSDFLKNERLVCHAKNFVALLKMITNPSIHCFWHEKDFCTLTSKGWVWKYPEVYFEGALIGICSDWL